MDQVTIINDRAARQTHARDSIQDGTKQFSYDARNRMSTVRQDETEVVYGYNCLGQRTMKTNGTMTEWSVYDNAARLANLQRTTENTAQEFVYLGLQPIAMIETDQACMSTNPVASNPASCATPKVTYLWSDHLGTPRRAMDAVTNQIVWSWESAPFGETPAQVDPRNAGTKTSITLRFPGQQYEVDTNLRCNPQRDYNPKTERCVQADPIGLAGGSNTYSYAAASPIAQFHPAGLTTWWEWLKELFHSGETSNEGHSVGRELGGLVCVSEKSFSSIDLSAPDSLQRPKQAQAAQTAAIRVWVNNVAPALSKAIQSAIPTGRPDLTTALINPTLSANVPAVGFRAGYVATECSK